MVSKNFKSGKLEIHKANEFYVMHDNDTTYEKWELPANEDLSQEDMKRHYGLPQQQTMIIHTLHARSDDEALLKERMRNKDHPDFIRNKTRVSVDNHSIPISNLKPYDSLKSLSKMDTKGNKKKDKDKSQHQNADDVKKTHSSKHKNKVTETTSKQNGSNVNGKLNDTEMINVCDGTCSMTLFFKNELLLSQERVSDLEKDNRALQEQNRKTVEEFTKQLSSINQNLKPREVKTSSNSVSNYKKSFMESLDGWSGAPLLSGDSVPEGKIHFGDGIMVDIHEIALKVEAKSMAVRPRVKELIKLIYPNNDVLVRFLDVNKVDRNVHPDAKPITPTVVTMMSIALEKMLWSTKKDVPLRSIVSDRLRRVLGTMRDEAKLKILPLEEQMEKKKAKAEKMKERRALQAAQKKAEKSKKKRKKSEVDDEEESESDKQSDTDESDVERNGKRRKKSEISDDDSVHSEGGGKKTDDDTDKSDRDD